MTQKTGGRSNKLAGSLPDVNEQRFPILSLVFVFMIVVVVDGVVVVVFVIVVVVVVVVVDDEDDDDDDDDNDISTSTTVGFLSRDSSGVIFSAFYPLKNFILPILWKKYRLK